MFWKKIRTIINSDEKKYISWKNWGELAEEVYQDLTLPFYEKWKHMGLLHFFEAYIKTYKSVLLEIDGNRILIPKKIIFFEAIERNDRVFTSLEDNPTFDQLRKSLLMVSKDFNISIRTTDAKIIQKLANPRFSKSLDRFPKMAELAYGTRSDVRTVTSRLEFLFETNILSLIYTIDMAKIGYQTITFFHTKKLKDIPSDLQEYIIFNFPSSSIQSDIVVMQYPYSNSTIIHQVEQYFDIIFPNSNVLQKEYRGWNFGGLTTDPNERWKLRPPLLKIGGNWNQDLILGKTGLITNLDPLFDPYELSKEEAKLLGFIQLYSTMDDASLEKQLKRSRKTIVADWKRLLQNGVISRFPIFSNLGLGSWVHFYISGLTPSHFRLVQQHFKFFPYSHIFFNELKGIVVGCVNMPLQWTHTFLYQLSSIPDEFPEARTSHYIGPNLLARWGINLMKTFDWNKFA